MDRAFVGMSLSLSLALGVSLACSDSTEPGATADVEETTAPDTVTDTTPGADTTTTPETVVDVEAETAAEVQAETTAETVLPDSAEPDTTPPPDTTMTPVVFAESYPLGARFPEGGIYDHVGEHFYVGSLSEGSVHKVDPRTGIDTTLFVENAPGTWWTLGMAVDEARRRLWVCAMDNHGQGTETEPPYDGYVWVFDLERGTRIANHALAQALPQATCTDVTLLDDGTAYVVDREGPYVYEVTLEGGPTLFAEDPALGGDLVGLNAVVQAPGQNALLAIVYLPPAIVRIDLATAEVRTVAREGDDFFSVALLAGADGMTTRDQAVYIAFSGKLFAATATWPDWSSVRLVSEDAPVGVTDIVNTPAGLYYLNGQAVEFALGAQPQPFSLTRRQTPR